MQLVGFIDASQILRSGVYVLVLRGVVIYIGKSKCMLTRIYSHRNIWSSKRRGQKLPEWFASMIPGIQFDEIHIRPCPLETLDQLERDMIDVYKPRFNTQLNKAKQTTAEVPLMVRGVALTLNQRPERVEGLRRI